MTNETPTTASEWIARLAAGPVSSGLQARLELWLESDPQNKADFALARMAWLMAGELATNEVARKELAALQEQEPASGGASWREVFKGWLPKLAPALAAAVVACVAGLWLWSGTPDVGLPRLANGHVAATAIDEITTYALPDGSTVTMNADSIVRVAFSRSQRQVILERGQAFFEVSHDLSKPFVVGAGAQNVVVTGTQFDVRYDTVASPVRVAVVEGHVKVATMPAQETLVAGMALSPGDVIAFPETGPPVRLDLAAHLVTAWRSRKLYFEAAPLRQVLYEVNRYSQKRLVLLDARLADLPITGSFRAGDTDGVLFALRELYHIQANDNQTEWLLSESAPAGITPAASSGTRAAP